MTIVEHPRRTNVEHRYPAIHWAANVRVERADDCLLIGADRRSWAGQQGLSSDPWRAYQAFPTAWSGERLDHYLPHILFANAETDEQLIAFTERYGPVVVDSWRTGLFPNGDQDYSVIVAKQDLVELRNERALYCAALTLDMELKKKEPDFPSVVRYLREISAKAQAWPQQWTREQRLRRGIRPAWSFDSSDLDDLERCLFIVEQEPPTDSQARLGYELCPPDKAAAAQSALCKLLNAFRLDVYSWGGRLVEAPDPDQRFGIRPVLYLILRRLSLAGGFGICANERCRKIFEIDKAGRRFCPNEVCSRQQRQREYWAEGGKVMRQKNKQKKRQERKKRTSKER
jgi:hypothetical protein